MSTILVTSLGSVAADIAIKSLRQLGHRVVGTDIYPKEFHVESYEVNAFYQSPYVNDILEVSNSPIGIDMISGYSYHDFNQSHAPITK